MEYQIALAPELGMRPAEFVTAWNEDTATRTVAEARLSSSQYAFDPLLAAGVIALISSVGVGVATNVLSDLIKQILVKQGTHKRTKMTQVDRPDGTHTLIVEIEEE